MQGYHLENLFSESVRTRLSFPLQILKRRDFQFLWLGEFSSLLGDQFYWIALPWLILKTTGDPLVMGSLLAVQMIPRSLFMLVGGALTDRFSPRNVMQVSVIARFILVGILTTLILTGFIHLWSLYILALLFGIVDGFYFPAQNSIVPSLLSPAELPAGNALIQGTAQMSMFLGPAVAGAMIAWLSGADRVIHTGQSVQDLQGIGIAFGIDMLGYLIASIMFSQIHVSKITSEQGEEIEHESVLESIRAGLHYAWMNVDLRIFFLLVAAMAFIVNGTITVGVPVLAYSRFQGGAAAFGIIVSSFGAGSLIGLIMASILPTPAPQRVGRIFLSVMGVLGFSLMLLAFTSTTLVAALLALVTGIGGGYILITVMTWLQRRTPPTMIGRTMSLLTFSTLGLNPFAMAIAGALSKWNVTALMFGSGCLLSIFAFTMAFSPIGRLTKG